MLDPGLMLPPNPHQTRSVRGFAALLLASFSWEHGEMMMIMIKSEILGEPLFCTYPRSKKEVLGLEPR